MVKDYGGHGVGKWFHCDPVIPHYSSSKVHGVMKPGYVFTIEPMINQGNSDVKVWPDKWTVVFFIIQQSFVGHCRWTKICSV